MSDYMVRYFSKNIGKLYTKRNHKIRDYLHKDGNFLNGLQYGRPNFL